jgi:hypothetical protein
MSQDDFHPTFVGKRRKTSIMFRCQLHLTTKSTEALIGKKRSWTKQRRRKSAEIKWNMRKKKGNLFQQPEPEDSQKARRYYYLGITPLYKDMTSCNRTEKPGGVCISVSIQCGNIAFLREKKEKRTFRRQTAQRFYTRETSRPKILAFAQSSMTNILLRVLKHMLR